MAKRIKVGLLGSLGVAVDCLEWLDSQPQFVVAGVVCTRGPLAPWRVVTRDRDMQDHAPKLNVPVMTLDEIGDLHLDIGLSVRFHQILRRRHLNGFRLGVVNLHGSILPEMRGSMCDVMALLENRSEFGAALHWMDEGIDSGPLLAETRFPIRPTDTAFDLFTRSNREGFRIIRETFADIATERISGENQSDLCARKGIESKTYRANDVIAHKIVKGDSSPEQMWNIARAFQFPGQSPASILTEHGKISLVIESTDASEQETL